jgi:hypothetical protein
VLVESGGSAIGATIGSGGTVFVASGGSALSVTFAGTSATLDLQSPTSLSGTIFNWQVGDVIDFVGTSVTSAAINGSTLTITTSDLRTFSYQVSGQQTNDADLQSDRAGGTDVILDIEPQPTLSVALTGSAVQGATLTATPTLGTDSDNSVADVTYQWQRNGSNISGATGSAYALGEQDEGASITVVASFTDDAGQSVSATSNASGPVADSNDLVATLSSNSPVQGTPISVTVTDNGATVATGVSYQWQVNGVDATGAGAQTATYTPTENDEGQTLSVNVTHADLQGNESASATATHAVADSNDLVAMLSSNSPVQGTPISVAVTDNGTTVSTGITYQWQVNGVDATGAGAQTATYTPTESDEGQTLSVNVTYADLQGNESASATATNAVADSNDLLVTLSSNSPVQGTPIGVTVTDNGTTVTTGVSYQWLVNGVNATGGGATTATYTPTETDEGKTLSVNVTYADLQGNESTSASATNTVADSNDLVAMLSSNSPVQGTPISVAVTDNGTTVTTGVSYQWQVNGVNATGTGATTASYTPTETDEGQTLSVNVTYADLQGNESTSATATNAVADSNDLLATLSSNSPVQGTPISVTVTDNGTTVTTGVSYQWQVNGVNATGGGATTATYTPTETDEGKTLSVNVTHADLQGNESTSATATNTVADSNDLVAMLSSNSPVQGTPISVAVTDNGTTVSTGVTYQWQVNGVNATGTGATTATYTPTENDEGKTLSVNVTYADLQGDESTSATATNTVADSNDLMGILSSQSPVQGAPISVTVTDNGTTVSTGVSYQWQVNGVDATGTGATAATYTPTKSDEGQTLSVNVTYADLQGNESTSATATNPVASSNDLVAMLSSNSPVQGTPVSVTVTDNGTTVSTGVTYQWQVNGVDATGTGATTATYTPTESDEGQTLSVKVTYAEPQGNESTSATTANPVADSSDLLATLSSNSPVQGTPISVTQVTDGGNTVSTGLSYQWLLDGSAIGGATGSSYTPTEADEGHALSVNVTYAVATGNEVVTQSVGTVGDSVDLAVTLSGSAVQGTSIIVTKVTDGGNTVSAGLSYQWLLDGNAIANATAATYTPTEADEGHALSVRVTYADASGNEVVAQSAGTVADSADLAVTLSGSPVQGAPISVTKVTDGGNTVSAGLSYQWLLDGNAIANATAATYTPTEADEGHALSVKVTYADASGNEIVTQSAGTVGDSPTEVASVVLSGLTNGHAVAGQAVTATVTDSDAPSSGITYTWQTSSNGTTWAVVQTSTGGTTNSYVPTEPDEGLQLRVVVSFTDTHGNVETGNVSAGIVTDAPPALSVTIKGTAQEGAALTAKAVATTDADGGTTTYQWQEFNGTIWVNISGATAVSYTVVEADEGHQIRVSSTFTDDTGQSVTAVSAPTAAVIDIAPSLSVSISGAAQEGQSLTAVAVANDSDALISYQWQELIGKTWTNISINGNSSTYVPVETDEGHQLRVVATSTDNDGGGTVTATSAPTSAATDQPPILTVPSTLTVSAGGSVALPIGVSTFDKDDTFSVAITGLTKYESVTALSDHKTFSGNSITLTQAEVVGGLQLNSTYKGSGQPVNSLTVIASDITAGESISSAAQTITVTDPPLDQLGGTSNLGSTMALLVNYMASVPTESTDGNLGAALGGQSGNPVNPDPLLAKPPSQSMGN